MVYLATAEANSNIAFIKYWGKRDDALKLPVSSSLSMTMDDSLRTRTTVMFSDRFREDEFYLNNIRQEGKRLERVSRHLDLIRARAGNILKAKVSSINTFPTGTGMASSASGFAALTAAAAKALALDLSPKDLSILARMGSGSAARSIHGGFVVWRKGQREDGLDSYAEQIADEGHWPDLRNIIVVLKNEEKLVSSTEGMKRSVATSKLLPERLTLVEEIVDVMSYSILTKDYATAFQLIMEDSDRMHNIMKDSTPPLMYMNDTSERIRQKVLGFNKDGTKAAYSFDAGPNAHIITLNLFVSDVLDMLSDVKDVLDIIVTKPGAGVRYVTDPDLHLIMEDGELRNLEYDRKTNAMEAL